MAVSESPVWPFEDVGPIAHVNMIDPAVFIDDDGQEYIYWGQFDGVRCAKLKENMVEIEPDTMTQPLSVAEHEFHEGSSVKKINGKYYYLFTDTHREVKMTTSAGGVLPAYEPLAACRACELSGNVRIAGEETSQCGYALTQIRPGDTATFRYLTFSGEETFSVKLKTNGYLRAELYLDGWYLASDIADACESYAETEVAIPAVEGSRAMQLKFYGDFSEASLCEFSFNGHHGMQ